MKKVSVYIPVYNGALYLERTFEGLFQQTIPFAEIIIVDDGSQDNTVSVARQYPVKIISHNYNKGVALARNTGIENSYYELVASVDVDCILDTHWLEKCMPFFDDVSVAGVGGKLLESMKARVCDVWRGINLIQHFGNGIKEVTYLSGSNTIYRKHDLMSVGLYNPHFQFHHEDIDISKRLIRTGKRLMYTDEARVFHIKQDTVYSVMRSCWGYRHNTYPHTCIDFLKDIFCELKHALSILGKSILHVRVRLLMLDSMYIFFQIYFCIKSYFLKTANFK